MDSATGDSRSTRRKLLYSRLVLEDAYTEEFEVDRIC